MAEEHPSKPAFTAIATRDGTYCIRMGEDADAPVLHIGSFDSEREAQAWIGDESATWLTNRGPREKAPRRRVGNVQ